MTAGTDAAAPVSPPGFRLTAEVADLRAIYQPSVNVVTLERLPSPALMEDSRLAVAERGFRRLFSVSADRARRVVPEELRGFPHLGEDVAYWVEALADLTGALRVGCVWHASRRRCALGSTWTA